MQLSTWLVGSYPDLPQQDFTITKDGDPPTNVSLPAGSYYLDHPSGALSLCDQLETLLSLAGLTGVDCRFLQNRKIEVIAIENFSVTWPGDGLLRGLFGFTGDLPGGTNSYEATNVSGYFWSGAKPATWMAAPVEVTGRRAYDQQISIAPDGTVLATGHTALKINRLEWRWVEVDRYLTESFLGGEYGVFLENVLRWGRNFMLWWKVTESDLSIPQTLPDPDARGPYIWTPGGRAAQGLVAEMTRSRGFERLNRRQDLGLDVLGAREYV